MLAPQEPAHDIGPLLTTAHSDARFVAAAANASAHAIAARTMFQGGPIIRCELPAVWKSDDSDRTDCMNPANQKGLATIGLFVKCRTNGKLFAVTAGHLIAKLKPDGVCTEYYGRHGFLFHSYPHPMTPSMQWDAPLAQGSAPQGLVTIGATFRCSNAGNRVSTVADADVAVIQVSDMWRITGSCRTIERMNPASLVPAIEAGSSDIDTYMRGWQLHHDSPLDGFSALTPFDAHVQQAKRGDGDFALALRQWASTILLSTVGKLGARTGFTAGHMFGVNVGAPKRWHPSAVRGHFPDTLRLIVTSVCEDHRDSTVNSAFSAPGDSGASVFTFSRLYRFEGEYLGMVVSTFFSPKREGCKADPGLILYTEVQPPEAVMTAVRDLIDCSGPVAAAAASAHAPAAAAGGSGASAAAGGAGASAAAGGAGASAETGGADTSDAPGAGLEFCPPFRAEATASTDRRIVKDTNSV